MKKQPAVLASSKELTGVSKRDYNYVIYLNRCFLTPLGVWPLKQDAHAIKKFLLYILIMICYILMFFLLIPPSLHAFLVETNIKKQMKMIGPMSFCIMALLKYCFLVARRKKIRICLDHMDVDWQRTMTTKDRELMLNDAKVGRFITGLCAIFMYSGAFFYRTILPFASPRRLLPDNTTMRPLVYPVYRPLFNTQKTPVYEMVFAAQWFGGCVLYTITVAACSIAAIFTLHICGQLKIVMSKMESFVETSLEATQLFKEKLGEIVELHIRALK